MIERLCGVDVSKDRLDVHLLPMQSVHQFENTDEGIRALADLCQARGIQLVAMEASGGYECRAFSGLWAAGLPCARLNLRFVRDFAKSLGYLEKTDRIDAAVIARYAQVAEVDAQPPEPEKQRELNALSARLRQVVRDITINKQRLSSTHDPQIRDSIEKVLDVLKQQEKHLEGEILSRVDDDPLLRKLDAVFREIKGVANRTIISLLTELPEIGTLSNKAVAKLAGLAPLAQDSGKHTGRRSVRGGRETVRSILFLVARIAARYHQGLADFHQRLIGAGKPKRVIRIALARKLLVILNAKARDARREFNMST